MSVESRCMMPRLKNLQVTTEMIMGMLENMESTAQTFGYTSLSVSDVQMHPRGAHLHYGGWTEQVRDYHDVRITFKVEHGYSNHEMTWGFRYTDGEWQLVGEGVTTYYYSEANNFREEYANAIKNGYQYVRCDLPADAVATLLKQENILGKVVSGDVYTQEGSNLKYVGSLRVPNSVLAKNPHLIENLYADIARTKANMRALEEAAKAEKFKQTLETLVAAKRRSDAEAFAAELQKSFELTQANAVKLRKLIEELETAQRQQADARRLQVIIDEIYEESQKREAAQMQSELQRALALQISERQAAQEEMVHLVLPLNLTREDAVKVVDTFTLDLSAYGLEQQLTLPQMHDALKLKGDFGIMISSQQIEGKERCVLSIPKKFDPLVLQPDEDVDQKVLPLLLSDATGQINRHMLTKGVKALALQMVTSENAVEVVTLDNGTNRLIITTNEDALSRLLQDVPGPAQDVPNGEFVDQAINLERKPKLVEITSNTEHLQGVNAEPGQINVDITSTGELNIGIAHGTPNCEGIQKLFQTVLGADVVLMIHKDPTETREAQVLFGGVTKRADGDVKPASVKSWQAAKVKRNGGK